MCLMRNLHIFFRNRTFPQEAAQKCGLDPPPHNPSADYKELSGYFSLAFQEFGIPNPGNALHNVLTPVMRTIETKQYCASFVDL